MNSQKKIILKKLQKGERITPLDALSEIGCFRLSGRIFEIREEGYDVRTEIIKTKSGKRIARYYLKKTA
jgi:hypothetical protein